MAYQLKSTGIAAACTMCIAVDPDTNAIKDFASSTVTADMTIGANVTTGSQSWDGNTRHYLVLGSGTAGADFVAFGTNKPTFQLNADGQTRTVVFIGEAAGAAVRVFGDSSTQYFASRDLSSGGSTYPLMMVNSTAKNGGNAALSAGNKAIFGFSMVRGAGGSTTAYSALHDAASMTVNSGLGGFTGSGNYTLDYIGRRDDSTTHQQDKIHAILIFSSALSEAEWDSLRDDWFTTLFESAGGSSADATAAAGAATVSAAAASTAATTATAAAGAATVSGVGGTLVVLMSEVFKNNTGTVLASLADVTVWVNAVESGALVVKLTGQTTDGSGVLTAQDAAIVTATQYRVTYRNEATGDWGSELVTAT